jgi:hypothetical protein
MKKTIKKLLLIALLLMPWATRAQGSLTVCNGTATNEYVPFYGYYADEAQNGQMIYPASSLTGMINTEITEMVFYVSSFGSWGSDLGDWIVSMGITNEIPAGGSIAAPVDNAVKDEAVSALTMLGFSPAPSAKVVMQILKEQPDAPVETVVKIALKMIK